MKLSDLKTGEKGIIVKVLGHGGFRKRVIEMGFIKGKEVEVLLNAPLQDPVKYKLMGYEVSLRHDEAELIEIISETEAERELQNDTLGLDGPLSGNLQFTDYKLQLARQKRRIINVALIGNPNCGKTSLFNFASGAHGRAHSKVMSSTSPTCLAPIRCRAIVQKSSMSAGTYSINAQTSLSIS